MARDYYEVLGVPKNASQDDVKKAFRKKAHELHPDKGGDAEAFKRVNEAYQVLGDEKQRAAYDRFGHAAFQGGAGPSGFGGAGGFGGFDMNGINVEDLGDLGDVIGSMFGFNGSGKNRTQRRGRDAETTVIVEFMETVHGTVKPVLLRLQSRCDQCGGTGADRGSSNATCTACKGAGKAAQTQRTPFGVFQSVVSCQACHGTGSVPEHRCHACAGSGVHVQAKTLQVDIPAGIGDGETLRLAGQGEAAPYGGGTGDLYVHIRVGTHRVFRREGSDVLSEEFAPLTVFLLGGDVTIETVDGAGELNVPASTRPGTVFKLRGKGIPFLRSRGRGDHLVTLVADVPKKLTKEQRKLIDELKGLGL